MNQLKTYSATFGFPADHVDFALSVANTIAKDLDLVASVERRGEAVLLTLTTVPRPSRVAILLATYHVLYAAVPYAPKRVGLDMWVSVEGCPDIVLNAKRGDKRFVTRAQEKIEQLVK